MQPPSGAPGRSSTVTALSGRVQGLKFMQRAAAINASGASSPSPSSGTSTPVGKAVPARANASNPASGSASPAPPCGAGLSTPLASASSSTPLRPGSAAKTDDDDEQWVLPSASLPRPSTSHHDSEPSAPEHEPGWNAWMASATSVGAGGAGRRSFGAWGKKARKGADEDEVDGEPALEDETGLVAGSDDEEENERRQKQSKGAKAEKKKGIRDDPPPSLRKGFVKPGSAGLSDVSTSLRKKGGKPSKVEVGHQQARKEVAKRKGEEMSRRSAQDGKEDEGKGKKKRRRKNKGGKEEREMGSSDEEAEGGFEGFADL